jgi:diguanylate cyclase (GGDEF)-like protein/PAS domain S-box-containing protein
MSQTMFESEVQRRALIESVTRTDVLERVAGAMAIHLYEMELRPDDSYACTAFVGSGLERLLGPLPRDRSPEQAWSDAVHPEDRAAYAAACDGLRAGGAAELEYRLVGHDGAIRWVWDRMQVRGEEGDRLVIDGIVADITGRKEMERALVESESRKKAVLDAALDCVITIDHEGGVVDFNPAAEATFGYSRAEVLGRPMAELIVPPALREAHYRGFRRYLGSGKPAVLGRRLELPAMRADGSEFPAEVAIVRVDVPGRPPLFTAYIRDITERKEAEERQRRSEEELKRLALHDALTGLPNRILFHDRIAHGIRVARREGSQLAIAILDLDRFKEINDALGHQSGDLVLQKLGKRLLATARESDTVARLGGDEFGLVFAVASRADAIEAIKRIQRTCGRPLTLDGVPLQVEASAGLALFPEHGYDGDLLLRRADTALYAAKGSDADLAVYDASHDDGEPSRLALGGELRRALDRRELVVYYQPQGNMHTGRVTGVEALVRWNHPARGLLPPDDFMPFAEHTGLMKPLTLYVLGEALDQCRRWTEEGHRVRVAVNVSGRNLLDAAFPAAVRALLERCRVPAEQLVLEITENTIATDPFRARPTLDGLSRLGVRLSIDDYGTGYSALSHLRRLPVQELKIDRSFVMSMATDGDDATIVRTTIDLAQNLGLEVVAEGVENQETYNMLRALGCDSAQGSLLGPPAPAEELAALLSRQPRVVSTAMRGAGRELAAGS